MRTFDHLRNPAFSSFLDLARWSAAWIVFLGHLRNPVFLGYGSIGDSAGNLVISGLYFVTGWFGEAVIVFFVLSGFLVGGIGLAKYEQATFCPKSYAIDRFSRLYLPFFPALVLTAFLDLVGTRYLFPLGLYDGSQSMFAEKLTPPFPIDNMSMETFFGSAFMLQNFRVEPFGSNPPLWTLSAEFWFYAFFGAGLAICIKYRDLNKRILVMAAGAAALMLILGPKFFYYFGMWAVGVMVALVPSDRYRWPLLYGALFFGLLILFRVKGNALDLLSYGQLVRDYGVAISFALVVHAMRESKVAILQRTSALNKRIADFSFSLYLIHFPLMVFILSALYMTGCLPELRNGYSPNDVTGQAIYLGVIALVGALSWLFAQATESQTDRVRSYLKGRHESVK